MTTDTAFHVTVTLDHCDAISDSLFACLNVARAETGLPATVLAAMMLTQLAELLESFCPEQTCRLLDLTSEVTGAAPDECEVIEARNGVLAFDAMTRLAAIEGAREAAQSGARLS